jgi:hypothetical protein
MSNKPEYYIGQIVYILSSKTQVILPARIVEQVTVQTLNEKSTNWKIAVGKEGDPKQKIFDFGKINGEVYTDLNEIKSILTKRLQSFIENLVKTASQREEIWYGKSTKTVPTVLPLVAGPSTTEISTKEEEEKENTGELTLEDSVSFDPEAILQQLDSTLPSNGIFHQPSTTNPNLFSAASSPPSLDELRNRLKSDLEDSETIEGEKHQTTTIRGPDGERYKVRLDTL